MSGKSIAVASCKYCPPVSPEEDGQQKFACCDTACIDIAAERECDADGDDSSKDEDAKESSNCASACCSGKATAPKPKKTTRNERLKAARERYAATLDAVGCICRALLARNLETCCSPDTKRTLRAVNAAVSPRASLSSHSLRAAKTSGCCSNKEPDSCTKKKKKTDTTDKNAMVVNKPSCGEGRADSCCGSSPDTQVLVIEKGSDSNKASCCSSNAPSKAGCCSGKDSGNDGIDSTPRAPPVQESCATKSCCSKKPDMPVPKEKCSSKTACSKGPVSAPAKTGCAKSCCGPSTNASIAKKTPLGKQCSATAVKVLPTMDANSTQSSSGGTKSGCSSKSGADTAKKVSTDDCCSSQKPLYFSPFDDDCAESCCDKDDTKTIIAGCKSTGSSSDGCCGTLSTTNEPLKPRNSHEQSMRDIERADFATEHIVLSVEGMTCVGCENKLFRSLSIIPGVQNLQTSLVMARAEFDLDAKASVDELIKEVAKTTEFACHRLSTKGQSIDIIVPGDARDFVKQKMPYGVENMTTIDDDTVRLGYDAKLIGARELLQRGFDREITLAPARPYAELESGSKHVKETFLMTLLSTVLTIPVLVLAWAPLKPRKTLYGSISLVLATIVQSVVAGPFYTSALKALIFTRVIEMDLLIVLSTTAAYTFSVVAFAYQVSGNPLSTEEFFQTSTLLVTLIMVGRLASAFSRHKAVESISVRSLQTQTALLVDDDNPGGYEIDARVLQYGDILKILPDSRIPTDGTVISGESEVDESHITGEAVLVEKSTGSNIIAGCLNGSGALIVRLRRLPGENTISEIAAMVDEAKFSKPKIQELADLVASYFVPVIIVLTLITFMVQVAVGIAVRHHSGSTAVTEAVTYAISVLIVACPCAIGLAVPMVVVIAGGVGARHGVLFKSAETIETARKVSHVVFDKTGTLTEGNLTVAAAEYLAQPPTASAASLVLGLTINSKHPVSAAVASYLLSQGTEPAHVEGVKSVTGSGMEGVCADGMLRGGNSRWLNTHNVPQASKLLSQGRTVFCVSLDGNLLVVFGLDDSLRPDAKSTVAELQSRGITVSIVSGDDDGAVQRIGRELGVDPNRVKSRFSPGDKQKYIKDIMDGTNKVVLFCGDGTNDAVALAQASIGLHMNSGTDVAKSAADAVLVRPALEGVLVLIDLSKAAFRRIFFNFAWSFVYNSISVLFAAGAFVAARLPPQYAGLGEIVSVLPVILIALQLRWFKPQSSATT
ncbi:uncharacterized protein L3040_001431 [Drepanopeziza brunnea f. sp. 'multigermtubi']|uniref:P-type copper atpase n=1 Tax=Marssonina brunnea f. sp. multigermtubi (strain MB_m1) TaxID=1072389 RepID=K1WGM6_MARBU|nr:p-type copper atpase [Drepanopeziza brunnea f. sp. 'multigermtubi' MB_m1]EKD16690.1 p-type copper atpase [Drepanopeziza brunnea f. sp. 'multigermtubi' MB_m1]KAJ5051656.1 hypothetical protein L3040_001431 [Drepanopeziza brunnea f. sp. 'multigermtubi']